MSLHQTTLQYLLDGNAYTEAAAVDVTHHGIEILWIPQPTPASYTADSLDALSALYATAAVDKRRIDSLVADAEHALIQAVYGEHQS